MIDDRVLAQSPVAIRSAQPRGIASLVEGVSHRLECGGAECRFGEERLRHNGSGFRVAVTVQDQLLQPIRDQAGAAVRLQPICACATVDTRTGRTLVPDLVATIHALVARVPRILDGQRALQTTVRPQDQRSCTTTTANMPHQVLHRACVAAWQVRN